MKHTIMKTLVVLLMTIFIGQTVYAAPQTSYYNDGANLLTSSEASNIESELTKFYETHDVPLYIFTITSSNGTSNSTYLSNLADQLEVTDAIFVLVNMEPSNRELIMQSYGSIRAQITPSRLQEANNAVIDYFADANYSRGFERIISYMERYITTPESVDSILFQPLVQLGISLLIALAVLSILIMNSKGKVTTTSMTYLDEGNSRVTNRYDRYINTTYVRTKRESNNSNGGGSSGSSGGGRSFNQSSNKF